MTTKKSNKKLIKSRWLQIIQELLLNVKTKEEIFSITKMLRKADLEQKHEKLRNKINNKA